MSYPPEASRSCHEADGRSDRSGGSGGAAGSSSGGVYGTLCGTWAGSAKFPAHNSTSCEVFNDPVSSSNHDRIVSNWKKWSLGLDYLLQDSEGVALFKSYLQYEGCSNLLDFWFACQGFRSKVDSSDHRKITQLIKAIYRTYIRGSTCSTVGLSTMLTESPVLIQPRAEPIRLRADTRKMIAERISRKYALDQTVFDPAQAEVEHFLRTTAYPAFLKSDIYVDFLQATLEGTRRGFQPTRTSATWLACTASQPMDTVVGIPEYPSNFPLGGKVLPTLEEDKELNSEEFTTRANSLGVSSPGAYISDSSLIPDFSPQQPYPFHCEHCSQYHFQGHQVSYPSGGCGQHVTCPPPYISSYDFRPPGASISTAPAPLTMENLQMTRFYRTELSLQHSFPGSPINANEPKPNPNLRTQIPDGRILGPRGYPYVRSCVPRAGRPHAHMNYVCTKWVDAVCPTPAHVTDHMLTNRVPTQPPNPYHISYAPVSARDSEHHSLSSEARTDDTHSHTDSSHDGATNRHWHCPCSHRFSSQPQSTHPTLKQQSIAAQSQSCRGRLGDHLDFPNATTTSHSAFVSSPKPVLSSNDASTQVRSKQPSRTVNHLETSVSQSVEPDHTKVHSKHQRRSLRRSLAGWRSGDRGKSSSGGAAETFPIETAAPTSKSASRSHNLAEKDPPAFFRLLSEKLQRILENQLSSERFDQLMTESASVSTDERHEERSPTGDKNTCLPEYTVSSGSGVLLTEDSRHPGLSGASVLQRPWADRLLAAARVQHERNRDNPQAILEDHCSRIWAASADRTPTSSGSGSGGGGMIPLLTEHTSGSDGIHSVEASMKQPHHPVAFQESLRNSSPLASQVVARVDSSHNPQRLGSAEHCLPHSPRSQSGAAITAPANPSSSATVGGDRAVRSHRRAPTLGQEKHSVYSSSIIAAHQSVAQTLNTVPSESNMGGGTEQSLARTPLNLPADSAMPTRCLRIDQSPTTSVLPSSGLQSSFTHQSARSSVVTSTASVSTPGLLASPSSSGSPHSLVIGYYLGDDPVPYRSVWPSPEITLGQFKQLIPKKKGSFRYFFKKCSNEFDSGVVHQEITSDNSILPLWEGKIVAKVERIE